MPGLQRLHVNHFGVLPPHVDIPLDAGFAFSPVFPKTRLLDLSLLCSDSIIEVNRECPGHHDEVAAWRRDIMRCWCRGQFSL